MTAEDAINALMGRCQAAWRRCPAPSEDFQIIYLANDAKPWYVGFYECDQGKHTATGATIAAALTAWLNDYEHGWETE